MRDITQCGLYKKNHQAKKKLLLPFRGAEEELLISLFWRLLCFYHREVHYLYCNSQRIIDMFIKNVGVEVSAL